LLTLFGPLGAEEDNRPTSYNSGTQGVKAAYLLAGELGYDARQWTDGPDKLKNLDAEQTTLVLAQPILPVKSLKATQDAIESFLERGGRVLATGAHGATLLPGGKTATAANFTNDFCYAEPEGAGELARAASGSDALAIGAPVRWAAVGPQYHVEARCGDDAVVVRYQVGKGEAIWWSSPMPLTNAGLHKNSSLALSLASLGPEAAASGKRTILFDEHFHEVRETTDDLLAGLPWWPLAWQSVAVAAVLVVSFGRRNGPLREPLTIPRTSPVEFADSMGRLYERAVAVEAALGAARRRLLRFLAEDCRLSQALLRSPGPVIAESLAERIGGDWTALGQHLEAAGHGSSYGSEAASSKAALKVVQALEADRLAVLEQVSAARQILNEEAEVSRMGEKNG
jgi:hypothetical protein